jgi:hypothetical protein
MDAGDGIPGGLERLLQPGEEPENLPAILVVIVSGQGQLKRPAGGERVAGVPFQPVQHLGDGRLGDIVQVRRPGETASFGERAEQPQDARLHNADGITQKGMAVKSYADDGPGRAGSKANLHFTISGAPIKSGRRRNFTAARVSDENGCFIASSNQCIPA